MAKNLHSFQHPAALYFSMGFAGYVTVCVQLYCVSFHCLLKQNRQTTNKKQADKHTRKKQQN
jgi:hypothetical protein